MRWVNIAKEISESTRRIRDKIIQDAKERARKIVEEANQKAKRILNEAEAKTRESREQVKAMTEQFYEEELKRRVAKARAENYQQIRSYQAQIVNEVFEKANTEIRNHMLSPEYAGLLRKLIVEAAVALEGGNLIVRVNEKDRSLLTENDLILLAKEVEVKTGVSTTLMLSKEPVDIIGGAVLTSIDGTATVDNSIEARLKRVKEENQGEVEAILFS